MTDDFIIKLFIKDNGKLQLNYMKKKWIESHEDIKQYLENRYDDFTGDINYAEIIYVEIRGAFSCKITLDRRKRHEIKFIRNNPSCTSPVKTPGA